MRAPPPLLLITRVAAVTLIYWRFDQSSMFSCSPPAVCVPRLIKAPTGCRVHCSCAGGALIRRWRWAARLPPRRRETKQPFNADQGFRGSFDSFLLLCRHTCATSLFLTRMRANQLQSESLVKKKKKEALLLLMGRPLR